MPKVDLSGFIEENINSYAQQMIEGGKETDEHALGEITFYLAMRRLIMGQATQTDLGMLDAINDTLVKLGLLEEGQIFFFLKYE